MWNALVRAAPHRLDPAGGGPASRGPASWGPVAWDRAAAATCLLITVPFEVYAEVAHQSWASHPLLRWLGILVSCAALL
ncbi:hypothetical protein ACIA8F_21930 [Streptomyces sp. NPDC051563]|uniref:hypothetical protein n=1 Tax=Streptomyces sp. NPDC051563 TaxID=3365659 RepID=UPI0037AE1AA3